MSEQSHLSLRKKKLFESRNCISIALNTTKTFLENKNWIVTKLFFLNHDFLDIIIKTTPLKLYSVSLRFNQKKEKKKATFNPSPNSPPPSTQSSVACKLSTVTKSSTQYTYRFSNFTGKTHIPPHLYFNVLTLSSM